MRLRLCVIRRLSNGFAGSKALVGRDVSEAQRQRADLRAHAAVEQVAHGDHAAELVAVGQRVDHHVRAGATRLEAMDVVDAGVAGDSERSRGATSMMGRGAVMVAILWSRLRECLRARPCSCAHRGFILQPWTRKRHRQERYRQEKENEHADRSRHRGTFTCDSSACSSPACKGAERADEPGVERPGAGLDHRSSARWYRGMSRTDTSPSWTFEPGQRTRYPATATTGTTNVSQVLGVNATGFVVDSDDRGRPAGTDRSGRQHERCLVPDRRNVCRLHLRQTERDGSPCRTPAA